MVLSLTPGLLGDVCPRFSSGQAHSRHTHGSVNVNHKRSWHKTSPTTPTQSGTVTPEYRKARQPTPSEREKKQRKEPKRRKQTGCGCTANIATILPAYHLHVLLITRNPVYPLAPSMDCRKKAAGGFLCLAFLPQKHK